MEIYKKIKENLTLILAMCGITFAAYMFFFGGIKKAAETFSLEQAFYALVFMMVCMIAYIAVVAVRSIKYSIKSVEYRKIIKKGDVAYLPTSANGLDVEVFELLPDNKVSVKLIVDKDRLYIDNNTWNKLNHT